MEATVTYARKNFTALLRRAEDGEVILLTRHRRPVLELRAATAPPQSEEERLFLAIRNIMHPPYLAVFEK